MITLYRWKSHDNLKIPHTNNVRKSPSIRDDSDEHTRKIFHPFLILLITLPVYSKTKGWLFH